MSCGPGTSIGDTTPDDEEDGGTSGGSTDTDDIRKRDSGGPPNKDAGGSSTDAGGSSTDAGGSGADGGTRTDAGGSGADGGTRADGGGSSSDGGGSGSDGGGTSSDAGTPVVRSCSNGAPLVCAHTTALPAGAPKLTVGRWTNIGPKAVAFGGSETIFTQGMTVDPCNSSTLFLAVSGFNSSGPQVGLWKSADAGTTWRKVGKVASANGYLEEPIRVYVNPNNSNHVYAVDGVRGGTMGFWVSCDGGESFSQPTSFQKLGDANGFFHVDLYDIAINPTDFNHILVTSHSAWSDGDSGILESKDGGGSWIVHRPGAWGTGHAINFLYSPKHGKGDAQTWLLGTQSAGMYRTTNSGGSWTKVSSEDIQHGGGDTMYDTTGRLYASSASGIEVSTDNGATWQGAGQDIGGGGYSAVASDGKRLYTAPNFGDVRYKTLPEGGTGAWTTLNDQTFEQGPFEMVYDPINHILYSASWAGGFWALKVE